MSADRIVGIVAIVAALLVILVWIPLDIKTGLIEKVRRQITVGDSLAPTVAAGFIALGGLMCLLDAKESAASQFAEHLRFLIFLVISLAVSLLLMRWAGPLAVDVAGLAGPEQSYRLLRDTAPWKYTGYVAGGLFLVLVLMRYAANKWTWMSIFSAVLAIILMIALFDLPFDDLLLPPNGDV